MNVIITRQSIDGKWYDNHIGETFSIDEEKTNDAFFFVKEDFLRWNRPIYKSDCEIISGDNSCKETKVL